MKEFKQFLGEEVSEKLREYIQKTQLDISKQLDKEVIKQLLLKVLERGLLPVLLYPEKGFTVQSIINSEREYESINITTPVPKLILYTLEDYITVFDCDDPYFWEEIDKMKRRVEEMYE